MTSIHGRRVHPAAFALTLALLFLGLTWIDGARTAGNLDVVTAVYAFATASALVAAWVANSARVMRWAMLASVGAWAFAAATVAGQSSTSTLLAGAWMVLAGGSYWLEVTDERTPR